MHTLKRSKQFTLRDVTQCSKTMEETFPKEVKIHTSRRWICSQGGVLPEYMDAKVIAPQCLEKNVAYGSRRQLLP